MFAPPPSALEYKWLQEFAAKFFATEGSHGIKIIDFSEVPADVLPIVTGVFARLMYDLQFGLQQTKGALSASSVMKPTSIFLRRTRPRLSRSKRCGTLSASPKKAVSMGLVWW